MSAIPKWIGPGPCLGWMLSLALAGGFAIGCGDSAPAPPEVAEPELELAKLYEAGRFEQAIPLLERQLAVTESETGEDSPATAAVLNDLGIVSMAAGHLPEAEASLDRALAIYETTTGPESESAVTTLSNLAELYLSVGRFRRSIMTFERVLAIEEKNEGLDSPLVGDSLEKLGMAHLEIGDAKTSEAFFARFVAHQERVFGVDFPRVAVALRKQAEAAAAQGATARADELQTRAERIAASAGAPMQ